MPVQEQGTKIQRPLPYEFLITDSVQGSNITIVMKNTGTAGVVLYVYNRIDTSKRPRKYTIEGGKSLSDTWDFSEAGKYDLSMHGPNGFVRKFRGGSQSHGAALVYDKGAQNVVVKLQAASAATLQVRDNIYGKGQLGVLDMAAGDRNELKHHTAEHGNW